MIIMAAMGSNNQQPQNLRLLLLGLLLAVAATRASGSTETLETKAMISIAQQFSSSNLNWAGDPCEDKWTGVVCDGGFPIQHVTEINLTNLGIFGSISDTIGRLKRLRKLLLQGNRLSGPLPASLGTLPLLEDLDLSGNPVGGNLPQSFTNLQKLHSLNISNCNIAGDFPPIIPSPLLSSLDVSGNSILDTIPDAISKLFNLRIFDASQNEITGELTSAWSSLTGLMQIDIADNKMYGSLPEFLGSLSALSLLDVGNNLFTGTVPQSYTKIQELDTSGNPFLYQIDRNKPPLPKPVFPPISSPSAPPPQEAPAVSPISLPPAPLSLDPTPIPPAAAPDRPTYFTPAPPAIPPNYFPAEAPSASPLAPELAPYPTKVAPAASPKSAPSIPPAIPKNVVPSTPILPPASPKKTAPPTLKASPPPKVVPSAPKLFPPPTLSPPLTLSPPPPVASPPLASPSPTLTPSPTLSLSPSLPPSAPSGCPFCQGSDVPRGVGADPCECVSPLVFSLRLSMNYDSFTSTARKELEEQLANNFGVDDTRVRVLSARPGSVYANIALLPKPPAKELSEQERQAALALLTGSDGRTVALIGFGDVTVIGVADTAMPPPSPPSQPPPSPPDEPSSSGGLSTGAIIGIAVGAGVAAVAIIAVIIVCCCCVMPKRSDVFTDIQKNPDDQLDYNYKSWSRSASTNHPSMTPSRRVNTGQARVFSFAELQMATDNFSSSAKIRDDPIGTVFLGDLPSGEELAIRRVDPALVEGQSDEDFTAIAANMARLNHNNVVPLKGFCVDFGQRMLVFDHYSNGSLYDHLHDPSRQAVLTWRVRVEMAISAARGLEYLHEECLPPIVHRNISTKTILLDFKLTPRITDAGFAVLNPLGADCHSLSDQLSGGFAYNAPEYAMSGIYTAKSDVYSFGVVLLEILTGRKPLDSSRPKTESSLVRWAATQLLDPSNLVEMVDPVMPGSRPSEQTLARFADIVSRCIQPEPEFRPSMSKVAQELTRYVLQDDREQITM